LKYLAHGCFGSMMEGELGNTFNFSSRKSGFSDSLIGLGLTSGNT
jgi:hypothetical protein